jgi:hypothetical protein
MRGPAFLDGPEPLMVSVHSTLSRGEVIERLERAVHERPYSKPDRDSIGFLRLGGRVAADHVTLTARRYVIPRVMAGGGAMAIELQGEVVQSIDGSEIRGTVNAPVRWTIPAFAVIALSAWAAFGIVGNGPNLPSLIFLVGAGVLMSIAWAWIVRHNQRMALRNTKELMRMVESIVSDPAGQIAPTPPSP